MIRFFAVLIFTCVSSFSAPGDILSVEAVLNGKFIDITISGLNVGGTYANRMGLGPNMTPSTGTSLITLTATSLGYDDNGNPTTISRVIYAKKFVRTPYGTRTIAGAYKNGSFVVDERVTQTGTGATAKIVIAQSSGRTLIVKKVSGIPNATGVWTGVASGAKFTPTDLPISYEKGPHEWHDGTNTHVRLALSDYIFSKDQTGPENSGTDVTYSIQPGFYSYGNAVNNAGSGIVINSSTGAYQKVIANWSHVFDYRRIGGNTLMLSACAFSRGAKEGRPVRCLRFSASDGTNTVYSGWLTNGVIDSQAPDAAKVIEYIGFLDVSTLAQGATITCNFQAYPWIGDSGSVLDTARGAVDPSPLFGPVKMLLDRTGEYGQTVAVVDAVNGSDPPIGSDEGKWLGDSSAFEKGQTGLTAYATQARAARAIRDYNKAYRDRDDVGAGVIYHKPGDYKYLGASIPGGYGSTPATYLTLQPFPGVPRSAVRIESGLGDSDISDRIRIYNMTITSDTPDTFLDIEAIWFDSCEFRSSLATDLIHCLSGVSVLFVTHCKLTELRQGIWPLTPRIQLMPKLVRGCDLTGLKRSILCYTVIGNKRTTTYPPDSALFVTDMAGQRSPVSDGCIIAFNEIYGVELTAVEAVSLAVANPYNRGIALVQNLIEASANTTAPNLIFVGSSIAHPDDTPVNNVLHWHNTLLGGRSGHAYSIYEGKNKVREYWEVVGLFIDSWGIKGDDFRGSEDADNIGNWDCDYGVGWSGNMDVETTNTGTNGAFPCEDFGLSSIQFSGASNDASYARFVNRQAFTGYARGAGGGDYHFRPDSPVIANGIAPIDQKLPYDLWGAPRTRSDPPGAFSMEYPGAKPTLSVAHSGDNVFISWRNGGALQAAETPEGPYRSINPEASNPYVINGAAGPQFFRVVK